MKALNTALISSVMALSLPVLAEEKEDDLCTVIEKHATVVMNSRQSGMKLSEMLKIMKDAYSVQVVIRAYKTPRYNSEKYQLRAANEFANTLHLECLESKNEK